MFDISRSDSRLSAQIDHTSLFADPKRVKSSFRSASRTDPAEASTFIIFIIFIFFIMARLRANTDGEEAKLPANLERECLEEVCDYEEAREVFQDTYRTDIFWSVYIDGDQCAEQPCKNGAMCSDSVGGYDCICKSGFSGIHCETDQTVCVIDKSKGCSQFCKPGYTSYECSCAYGWKLQEREKCVPAVTFPCGKVASLSQWARRQSSNVQSDYEGLTCGSEECPWQCIGKYSDFQVAVGKRVTSFEAGEQTLQVKQVHIHPLYAEGKPDNDMAVVELTQKIVFKKSVLPACLPERDFADSVLMAGDYMGVVTGWKEVSGVTDLQGNLMLNHLSYDKLPVCSQRHSGQVTNKMACTMPRAKADCILGNGSPVLTLYREVFFLTGIVSKPSGTDCKNGYVLQKVSRFLPWLNTFMRPQ
ncbi:Venom prothrombin activator vestarin-D1 [Labeo rohita]|uniref:Venom prothrombin activator vestarin-D1 n=1 Tax=Labeo rohita TaxID=84645 RepID=A0ABQ8L621_LABRO|nr:Venom prothrombin activator vestarin-D1 [Labeo rohita]